MENVRSTSRPALWLMLLMVWRFNPLHYSRHFD